MNENSGLISWISERALNPQDEPFFTRNTHPSHRGKPFSREIRAPAIQASLFLEKYAPQPSRQAFFSRNMRPNHPNKPFSREIRALAIQTCLFLEKNEGTQIDWAGFLGGNKGTQINFAYFSKKTRVRR